MSTASDKSKRFILGVNNDGSVLLFNLNLSIPYPDKPWEDGQEFEYLLEDGAIVVGKL